MTMMPTLFHLPWRPKLSLLAWMKCIGLKLAGP